MSNSKLFIFKIVFFVLLWVVFAYDVVRFLLVESEAGFFESISWFAPLLIIAISLDLIWNGTNK